jgi:hypothetical protein
MIKEEIVLDEVSVITPLDFAPVSLVSSEPDANTKLFYLKFVSLCWRHIHSGHRGLMLSQ